MRRGPAAIGNTAPPPSARGFFRMSTVTLNESVSARRTSIPRHHPMVRQGVLQLLQIKDSDVRILTLEQARDAVDKGLHSGGAFSATIPLVALFYGGFIRLDITDPTRRGQDIFTLDRK